MMAIISRSAQVLLLLILASASGCSSGGEYDLSQMPPFSQYSGKRLLLTRSALLLERVPVQGNDYQLCYQDDWDAARSGNALLYGRRLVLPAGTAVRVLKIHFWYEQQSIFQGFFSEAGIGAMTEITPNAPGWPATVNAWFNYASNEFIVDIDKRNFKAAIRPAPWEPLDTSAQRRLPWPDDKYLDKSGSD